MTSSESNLWGWEKAPSCVKRVDRVLQVWSIWAVISSALDCWVDRCTSDHSDLCWRPHVMLDRGLFTLLLRFLSNYSKKKQKKIKKAGRSLVKNTFPPSLRDTQPSCHFSAQFRSTLSSAPRDRQVWRRVCCAQSAGLLSLVLSILSVLIMAPPGGNLFPIADSDL